MEPSLFSQLTPQLIAFGIALICRAIFSFLETAVTALRLFKLKELAQTTERYQHLFETLEKNPQRILITTLIASSLSDVTTAALATSIMEDVFAHYHLSGSLGFSLGIFVATIAILLFGEIIPKNLAKGRGEKLFRSTLWFINIIFYLFYPLVSFLVRFSDWVIALIGGRDAKSAQWVTSEKEIQFLIDYINEKGLIGKEKTEMLQNIFELGRTPVKEIMVPATDIVTINVANSLQDTLGVFVEHRYTRLPVYQDSPDNIIGMVHLKDIFVLLSKNEKKPLKELVRPILFVPETLKVNQLLREFRSQHMHIAMVINEHGSIIGLITLEDVLEEIVGEISDEHEPTEEKIVPLKQGGWLVDASITLEDVENFLHITFETEESITLGGFLAECLQHLPKKGERIAYKGYYFQVQKASLKRVLQVLIFQEKKEKETAEEAPEEPKS